MKVIDILRTDATKAIAWLKSKEPAFVSAAQAAARFTSAALAWAKSNTGQSVEDFLNANAPDAPKWEAEATTIATALLTDMMAVKSPQALEGIALRLGAELLSLFDGKKLPTGIDGYLAEFQQIFVG